MIALIGFFLVGLFMPCGVEADPIVYTPATELPTLTTQTPEPSSPIYANNDLELNFTVIIPQSWDIYYHGIPTVGTAEIFLYLDGVSYYDYNSAYTPLQYTAVFTNLTQQQHTVWIDVYCYLLANGSDVSVSQTLTFTIDAHTQTIAFHEDPVVTTSPGTRPTVAPTLFNMPTLNPTATSTPNPTYSETPTNKANKEVFHISFLSELALVTAIIIALCLVVALILRRRSILIGRQTSVPKPLPSKLVIIQRRLHPVIQAFKHSCYMRHTGLIFKNYETT